MLVAIAASFALTTATGPVDAALDATEVPTTLRAAFTVELTSDHATRVFHFDPRLPADQRWVQLSASGEDADLDDVAANWGRDEAPDGRLFPDDLRASLGHSVNIEDLGAAWRVRFHHTPSANDGELDIWAAQRLAATAWLDPTGDRFVRIDYQLPEPVRGPSGGRLIRFDQSYYLETEPRYGMSIVTALTINLEARTPLRTFRRAYSAQLRDVDMFFASRPDEKEFLSSRQLGAVSETATR